MANEQIWRCLQPIQRMNAAVLAPSSLIGLSSRLIGTVSSVMSNHHRQGTRCTVVRGSGMLWGLRAISHST